MPLWMSSKYRPRNKKLVLVVTLIIGFCCITVLVQLQQAVIHFPKNDDDGDDANKLLAVNITRPLLVLEVEVETVTEIVADEQDVVPAGGQQVQVRVPHAKNTTSSPSTSGRRIPGKAFEPKNGYSESYLKSTMPWIFDPNANANANNNNNNNNGNITTMGYQRRHFYSGYRNQIMAFSSLVMWTKHYGHEQLLLETLFHKDTYGSDRMLPFSYLFDVEHWNKYSHHPHSHSHSHPTTHNNRNNNNNNNNNNKNAAVVAVLPRLVRCVNATYFKHFDCEYKSWIKKVDDNNNNNNNTNKEGTIPTNPYAFGESSTVLFANYLRYSQGKGPLAQPQFRNPIDLAILQGALKPHPDIQRLMDNVLYKVTQGGEYFTLHPRVEPDMQKHPMCPQFKVTNLTDIFDMLQRAFPIPPANKLFLPINRPTLEADLKVRKNPNAKKKTNWLAIWNVNVLNNAITYGLWNGTVEVFELGSNILNDTKFAKTPSTIGAMMNFEFALHSKVFIGTPVSSWSSDVMASRFYRKEGDRFIQNYQYLPSGIQPWTTSDMVNAPPFHC